jgi:DHA2 family multidrug resistance protein
MAGLMWGMDPEPLDFSQFMNADWLGIALMALGLGSLTIFLEEGNSKDWFDSQFIITFAALATFGILGWVAVSFSRANPFVNLGLYGKRNFLVATALSAVIGMGLYGSSFLLPLFLGQIANYTPMQIGEVIGWMGFPQLLVMPFAAALSSRVDNRILCSFGLALFGGSCLMNAFMDASTGYDQLIVTQVIRAVGQPFVMLTLSNFAMQGIKPQDMPSASSLFNMTRNLGGSIGIALLATALTNREHFHSARLGEAVSNYSLATQQRLDQLTQGFIAGGIDPAGAADKALRVVDNLVRRESYVMAYNDGFLIVGLVLVGCIAVIWFADKVKSPGGPGSGAH